MIQINAIGDACPIPVVKTMNAMKTLTGAGVIETTVDNETAVQNLTRFANSKNCAVSSVQLGKHVYQVTITVGKGEAAAPAEEAAPAAAGHRKNTVVAIASNAMDTGDDKLDTALMKGFIYALSQQEELPSTILFYNGGASLSCEGSPALDDLKEMAAQGVEILTCGTCLDFYGIKDTLAVGDVTNMYSIVEKMTGADLLVRP